MALILNKLCDKVTYLFHPLLYLWFNLTFICFKLMLNFLFKDMNYFIRNFISNNVRASLISSLRTVETSAASTIETKPLETTELDKLYKIVELELRGNEPAVLKSFAKFATSAGQHLDVESKSWNLKKPIHERYTVLKAAHIFKKHRVQYETRTYYMFIGYKHLTGSTANTLLEYVERNLPEGVALKATKVELQKLPDYFQPPSTEANA